MAFLQVAFDSLASKAVMDYFRREKLDVKLLKNLKIRMLAINQLIDDAEDKEATNLALKEWLDELKDVVFDTEDVLDVIATQAHENEVSSSTPWNPFDRLLHQELEDVLYRMKCLLKQKEVFGLKPSTRSNSTSETLRPPTTSLVEKSSVYGRADDKEEIKKLLLSNDGSNIGDVIAIVGMGGLGKTTLAQFVFNDYQINSVFKLNKVWICVAEDFDVIKITKTILEKMTSQSCYTDDFDDLQMKLQETLTGKRFLIALDDVWNENDRDWDELRKPFNFGAPGSKIMVTTRNTRVASAMRAISTYKLQVLSNEDCWLLFAKHAFENISPSSHSKFEVVGRKLVKKCQGLPLAARVLGCLLRMKVAHTEEWDEVLNNDIWNSSDEESESKILPVLRLSYLYLPSHLKRCFSFCSLIPKDYAFEREKIVMLWMAESLLPVHGGKKKRIDIGYEYLGNLESRSLIQASIEGKSHFAMHDLVNDLATAVSGDFYKRCDIGNSFEVGKQTRHFSYLQDYKYKENDLARLQVISEAKRLRSLMPLGNGWRVRAPHIHSKILPQLKLIRTLILSRSNIEKIHDSIGNLKLLHYLDLSCNPKLNHLPESLARLYNLEVLILEGCRSLTELPSKISQLTKLNYLDITRTTRLKEMPLQMGRLKDLDVLTGFVLGKDSGSSIAELKELTYLRGQLSIRGLQNITHPEDALVANLQEKSCLEELWLEWDIDHGHSEDARIILENLRPHVNLKRLSIWQYSGTRLPNWSGHYSFVNLVYIKLVGFKHLFDLSPLGQLPSLKSLSFFFGDSLVTLLGTETHYVGHFSALVNLDIFDCPKLELPQHHRLASVEDFTLYGGSCASLQFFPLSLFPNLKRLCLKETKSLESLLVINEVNNINLEHLEAIEIRSCPNFEYLNAGKWCAPKMKYLELQECESFKDLPENMCSLFPSLESLSLYQCPKLEAFPKGGLPSSLRNLKISGFECDDLESFPEDGLLHSSLSTLLIEDVPHLRSLNGKSFQLLTSLEKLELSNCPNLRCLPELPTSLSSLIIRYCPMLESRCRREQGEDWSKIAHIPNILVGL